MNPFPIRTANATAIEYVSSRLVLAGHLEKVGGVDASGCACEIFEPITIALRHRVLTLTLIETGSSELECSNNGRMIRRTLEGSQVADDLGVSALSRQSLGCPDMVDSQALITSKGTSSIVPPGV